MFNLKDELKDIEEELARESSGSSSSSLSSPRDPFPSILTPIEDHFDEYDPVSQKAKLEDLREKIIEWENGNDLLKSLAQQLRSLLIKEERKLASENRFIAFEEYRRLSYDLNIKEKIDGKRICEANVDSDYNFIVEAPDNDNNPQKHYAKILKTTHSDLVSFVLIPMDENKTPCEIKLTFQGTTSADGWYRNLTGQGSAGINELNANKVIIIYQLMQEIKKIEVDRDINLSIIGHSLGGADAQNIMVEVMKEIGQKNSELSRIKNLSLYVYNPAGITRDTRRKSLELAEQMKSLQIKIDVYFAMVGGDIVQQVGMANIFVGLKAEYANFTLVKTNCGMEGIYQGMSTAYPAIEATINAHTGEFFTSSSEQFKLIQSREYFFNDTPEGVDAIAEKCGEHKFAAQNPNSYNAFQKTVKKFAKSVGKKLWEKADFYRLSQVVKYMVEPKHQEYFIDDAHFEGTRDLIEHILSLEPRLSTEFFDKKSNGTSFFIECVKLNRVEVVALLCKKVKQCSCGYLINMEDNNRKTALAYVLENEFQPCLKILQHYVEEGEVMMMFAIRNPQILDESVSSKTTISGLFATMHLTENISRGKKYERGNTIFHYLAQSYHVKVPKIFGKILFSKTYNATPPYELLSIKNDVDKTPVDYLKEYNRIDIIDVVLKENEKHLKEWGTGSWSRGYKGYVLKDVQKDLLLMIKKDIERNKNDLVELPESPNPIIYSVAGQEALSSFSHRNEPMSSPSSSSSSSSSRSSKPF